MTVQPGRRLSAPRRSRGVARSVEYLGSTVQVGIDVVGLDALSAVVPEARFDAAPVSARPAGGSVMEARGRARPRTIEGGGPASQGGDRRWLVKLNGGVGRRRMLKGAAGIAGAALGSGAITGFPTIWAQNNKNIVLRQFGTGVSNINEIADKCKADLGITLQMTALDSDAVVQRVVTQPNSFDIGDIEYWMIKKVFPANILQAMDVKKIKYFDKIVPIFTTGKLKPDSVIAQGTAPSTVSFVEAAGRPSSPRRRPSGSPWCPTIYNADTLGIRPDLVGRKIESWKDILDPKFKGKTSILNIPSIGIMDAAMICEIGRHREVRRQGQHDQGGDRQDHRFPDQDQEGRPVPRLLEDLRRDRSTSWPRARS